MLIMKRGETRCSGRKRRALFFTCDFRLTRATGLVSIVSKVLPVVLTHTRIAIMQVLITVADSDPGLLSSCLTGDNAKKFTSKVYSKRAPVGLMDR